MKIQIASDLHTEMHADGGLSVCDELIAAGGADVLVLAGDIASLRNTNGYSYLLARLKGHYSKIIAVIGNHEVYMTDIGTVNSNIEKLENDFPVVHFLDLGASINYNGQRFFGGTGWFPVPSPIEATAKKYMNDFRVIKDFETWVYDYNSLTQKNLAKLEANDVLITHHLPRSSIHPKYAKNILNGFFTHAMDDVIFSAGPKLYIHGHTHEQMDYMVNNTRVVCNPMGYMNEPQAQKNFNPALFVEV